MAWVVTVLGIVGFLAGAAAGRYGWALTAATMAGAVAALISTRRQAWSRASRGPTLAACALFFFIVLTLIPLPLQLTRVTGGQRYRQNAVAAEKLERLDNLNLVDPGPLTFSITRNRTGTLRGLALLVLVFSILTVTSRMPKDNRTTCLRLLVLAGSAIGVAGHVGVWIYPQGDTLWWRIPIPHFLPGPAACFVNRNHFGGYLAILLPAAAALTVYDLSGRRWMLAVLSGVCAGALGFTLFHSLSRGGIVAGAAGLLLLPFLTLKLHGKVRGLLSLAALAVIMALAVYTASPPVREEVTTLKQPMQTSSLQSRTQVWREAAGIWLQYPVMGAGLDSFRMVYPQHRTSSVRGIRAHAENQFVECLTDFGVLGYILVIWFAVEIGRMLLRANHTGSSVLTAALSSLAVTLVHAGVDFPHYIPLYSVTIAAVTGLALPPLSDLHPRVPFAGASGLAFALLLIPFSGVIETRDSYLAISNAPIGETVRAIVWAPTSRHAWQKTGMHLWKRDDADWRLLGEDFYTQATAYDPNQYTIMLRLGRMRLKMKDYAGARIAFERVRELRDWVKVPEVPEEKP